jgi:hypothetical protein
MLTSSTRRSRHAFGKKQSNSACTGVDIFVFGLTECFLLACVIQDQSEGLRVSALLLMMIGTGLTTRTIYTQFRAGRYSCGGSAVFSFGMTIIASLAYSIISVKGGWTLVMILAVSCELVFLLLSGFVQFRSIQKSRSGNEADQTLQTFASGGETFSARFAPAIDYAPEISMDWKWPESDFRQQIILFTSPYDAPQSMVSVCYPAFGDEIGEHDFGNLPVHGPIPFPSDI